MATPTAERPNMPDYGITKDKKGLMDWQWAEDQLKKSPNYWICTTRDDGRPHAAPVWGAWVDGALYFGTSPTSVKGRNLTARPDIVVHLESGDDTVILEGKVEFGKSFDNDIAKQISESYQEKYKGFSPEIAEGLYVFRPHKALTWLESSFPNTATRWQFAETKA